MEHNDEQKLPEQNNQEHSLQSEHTNFQSAVNDDPGLTKPKEKLKKKEKAKGPSSVKAFFFGILGGLIPVAIFLLLLTNNILPFESPNAEVSANESNQSQPEIITTMASEDAENSTNLAEVSEAVVGVTNLQRQSIWTNSQEAGTGSGIIYKKEDGKAYVVTNHHVVDGAEQVEVVLSNGERVTAKVLGSDQLTDLAVLEIDGDKVNRVATFGTTEGKQVGETVFAIGNPLGIEFANSLTKGIISGLERSVSIDTNGDMVADWITEVIQTDAAINPGNSGGALVDSNGEVIGINSMKIASTQVEGIGFAIPIDAALPIMEQLETNGKVQRPFIGISMATINQVPMQYRHNINLPEGIDHGMVVASIEPGSPADEAGLQQFDVITKINDHETPTALELRKYMYTETQVGDTVKLEIYRNGKKQMIDLKLTERYE
ncbi:S1C family serine protease [Ornithinibacillus californiensis]|uniref:S1C family serine protease n=1 Tax=Ornithinibacillus californiensis TaxID=161536 RepID=UPI00064E0FF3|nr:trypsin-like peptidase domain-containing protein [Ornithinibacillus californiensis]